MADETHIQEPCTRISFKNGAQTQTELTHPNPSARTEGYKYIINWAGFTQ